MKHAQPTPISPSRRGARVSALSALGALTGVTLLALYSVALAPARAYADEAPAPIPVETSAPSYAAIPGSVQAVTQLAATPSSVATLPASSGTTAVIPGSVEAVPAGSPIANPDLPLATAIPETSVAPASPSAPVPSPSSSALPLPSSSPSSAPTDAGNGVSPDGGYTIYTNVLAPYASSVTADELANAIDSIHPRSPLVRLAPTFLAAANDQGINPLEIVAHAATESGWGTTHIARTKGNLFGYNAFDSNPGAASTYSAPEESIRFYASYMKSRYLTPGNWRYNGATLHGIFVHYSTSHDSEAHTVATIMNELSDAIVKVRKHSSPSTPAVTPEVTQPFRKDDDASKVREAIQNPETPTPEPADLDQLSVVANVPEFGSDTTPQAAPSPTPPPPVVAPVVTPIPSQSTAQEPTPVPTTTPTTVASGPVQNSRPTSGNFTRPGSSPRKVVDPVLPEYGYTINVPASDPASNNMFYFSQNKDPRWAHIAHVFGKYHDIAECGCGPTTLAMIFSTLKGELITPIQVAHVMKEEGALNWPCGTNGEDRMAAVAARFGLHGRTVGGDWSQVDQTIKNGGMAAASTNHSTFGGSHYIAIRGITEDGKYLAANPLEGIANDGHSFTDTSEKPYTRDAFPLNHGFFVVDKP